MNDVKSQHNFLIMNDIQKRYLHKNFPVLSIFIVIGLIVLQQSCKKDEKCTVPQLDSITLADSALRIDTIVPTRVITLHGTNLTDVTYLYINQWQYDARYLYNPDTTLTFTVPYVTSNGQSFDSITVIKNCGKSTLLVKIIEAPPYIKRISNENAVAGDTITVFGKYFTNLKSADFPSDQTGEIIEGYNDSVCHIVVPQGVINEGELFLTSLSGTSTAAYGIDFHDRSGILCNFDDVDTWEGWGGSVINNDEDITIPEANGYFFVTELNNIAPGSSEIANTFLPIDVENVPAYTGSLAPGYFAIQTEMYLKYPWKCGYYKILLGKLNEQDEMEYRYEYNYEPWSDSLNYGELKTNGWETVTIPLTGFMYNGSSTVKLQSYSQLREINYMQWSFVNPPEDEGGRPLTHFKMALDNIRLIQTVADPE
jgi:hypothetical protein